MSNFFSTNTITKLHKRFKALTVGAHYAIAFVIALMGVGLFLSYQNQQEYAVFAPWVSESETNETKTKPEPFKEEIRDDPNLDSGKREVRREGKNGIRTFIYKVTHKGEKEISRVLVSEKVTKKPVSNIIANGTRIQQTVTTPVQTTAPSSPRSTSSNTRDSLRGLHCYEVPYSGFSCY